MQHIGFIMDGNRRWAKKLGNLVKIGHENGGKKFEEVIFWSLEKHLSYISFWALSKENILERSTEELEGIFMVFRTMFPKLLALALERDVRLTSIGDIWLLPPDIRTSLIDAIEKTKNNTKMTVILAIAYSGQDEIIRGFRRAIAEGYDLSNLTEKDFLQFLDSGAYPPPDLIVRTGGAVRHSGYFLYQSAYSEYAFTETLWPDFSREEFDRLFEDFAGRKRNFGK